MFLKFSTFALLLALTFNVFARDIGSVNTVFKALGSNDKIVVVAFTDPHVPEITCYLSRAKTGGVTGMVGLAEDKSEASLSCIKTRVINMSKVDPKVTNGKYDGDNVYKVSTSITFKSLQVVRFYDKQTNSLVYLTYSDKLIEGSPNNTVFAVSLN